MTAPVTRELRLPCLRAEARIESFDESSRSVSLLAYSGAVVERVPLFADPFRLSFSLDAKAVDLGRLRSGAPVKRGHAAPDDVDAIVGVTSEPALSKDGLRVRARFSKRADVEPLLADVRDGIVKAVSIEAKIDALEDVTKKGEAEKHYRATKWTPLGVAFVAQGADPSAQVLAHGETFLCTLTRAVGATEKLSMEDTDTDTDTIDNADEQPKTKEQLRAENAELRRRAEAHRLAAFFGLGDLQARRWIDAGASRKEMLHEAARARADREPVIDGRLTLGLDYDSPGARVEQMAEGLAARIAHRAPSEVGRRYADASFVELAFETLSWRGYHRGLDVRRNASRIVQLAHTTSDFPLLLANALNKNLLPSYELAQPTFKQISAVRQFNNFLPHPQLRGGDFPLPLQLGEAGEITQGTMSESRENISVLTFARIFDISRVALVNDDVGFFQQLTALAARRVADFHNAHFFSTSIAAGAGLGPAMADGLTVYHATHSNTASAGALSVTLIGESRAKMMSQTSLDGLKLNLLPRYLLVSPTSLTLAEQYTAELSPQVASEVNPFGGRIIPLGDANLTGTRFYLLADPAVLPQYVHGFLDGVPLRVETRTPFETEGLQVKVVTDFAVGVVEHRAGVTGAGA